MCCDPNHLPAGTREHEPRNPPINVAQAANETVQHDAAGKRAQLLQNHCCCCCCSTVSWLQSILLLPHVTAHCCCCSTVSWLQQILLLPHVPARHCCCCCCCCCCCSTQVQPVRSIKCTPESVNTG
jgi:hypothetical protein